MAKTYDGIDADMAAWIERQPVFFVATAPLATDGLVNVSPKGASGTFRVVDAHTFAYLDSRSRIVVDVARVSGSCGYAVPRMELEEERETPDRVWRTRDDEQIAIYHAERNATSRDGLPGLGGPRGTPEAPERANRVSPDPRTPVGRR